MSLSERAKKRRNFLIVPATVWEKPQRAICVEARASSVRGKAASTGLSKYCVSVAPKSHIAGIGVAPNRTYVIERTLNCFVELGALHILWRSGVVHRSPVLLDD